MIIGSLLEEFDELVSTLRMFSESGVPIVVEGIKDERSLRELGVSGLIIRVSGKSLLNIAEELALFENFLILTDFDSKGQELAWQLFRYLGHKNVDLSQNFRRRFGGLISRITGNVEGLAASYLTLKSKYEKTATTESKIHFTVY
jgi:2,5-diamino-6-(ribosylamino)-4(3H)-pyrimidinone 5'-phosphate reductase